MISWLTAHSAFPDTAHALREPNGLLCAGGDLSPARLLDAYRHGIFPWFSPGDPLLWWSPDPRMVLFPSEFNCSRSLRKTLRGGRFEVRLDSAFAAVMEACANAARPGQSGTWISPEMRNAYGRLHELGYAHSVETWVDGELAGGLYGVCIGRMFYGESMFAHVRDASKIALAHLVRFLDTQGVGMIDCQMKTGHLASLGAREIARSDFTARLEELVADASPAKRWPVDGAQQPWR
ncbi:leucyl/phenylalanyl-tRNA--protein transferase [Rhodocyclus gracilis]|uniref:Leucyl/phenylalanyl-tRNA--protein transferase n=1 Tax=Rhodocyclus tenuis TaxID=1066 RepID=A0A6L5JUX9_RHOTE|nr:leucyl/phenylalanyl-tRNA--protein transferase [Rhodocyclus gracilis]